MNADSHSARTPGPLNPRTRCPDAEEGSRPAGVRGHPQIAQIEFPSPGEPHRIRAWRVAASARVLWVAVFASCFRDFEANPFPLLPLDLQEAIEVATEVPLQVPLQIAPQVSLRVAIQVGWEVGSAAAARVRPQVTFREGPHVAVQTGRRIAGKTRPPTPTRVLLETTPGTVLGTVRRVIRRVSILTALIAPKAASFGYLGQPKLA